MVSRARQGMGQSGRKTVELVYLLFTYVKNLNSYCADGRTDTHRLADRQANKGGLTVRPADGR